MTGADAADPAVPALLLLPFAGLVALLGAAAVLIAAAPDDEGDEEDAR